MKIQSDGQASELARTTPYVLPFAVFFLLIALQRWLVLPANIDLPLRVLLLTAVLWIFSRSVISFRLTSPIGSIALGIAVFIVWVAPDILMPHYREHWLFQNSVFGTISTSAPDELRRSALALALRTIRAVILVPILEELFWRAWLMRWLINAHFETVPLGAFSAGSFILTALLFASEHGPFWDVGLIAGLAYNWWMVRTKSLGDCILAHAVTNACLCGYVMALGKWQYWL